jgi:hypothetical protein
MEARGKITVERALRGLAGTMILLSLALAYWVHPGFYLLTAFVGANLLQSFFTDSCPAMWMFRRFGLQTGADGSSMRKEVSRTSIDREEVSHGSVRDHGLPR